MVSGLTFSSLIHFDLLAEREVRKTIPFMIATAKTKISRNKFNQEGKTCTLKNISHFWIKVKKLKFITNLYLPWKAFTLKIYFFFDIIIQ